jgi:enoyl-CoA hydratase/carnithine racemase
LKSQENEEGFEQLLNDGREIVRLLRSAPKPTVAMVRGVAYGAGFFLAIACDLRFCGDSASLGVPLVNLGLGPEWGGTYLLPRLAGSGTALHLLYSGEGIGAREALRVGLADCVWPDSELTERTEEYVARIVQKPADVLARHKKAVYETMDRSFAETAVLERQFQMENFRSQACADGIAAFMERRSRDSE